MNKDEQIERLIATIVARGLPKEAGDDGSEFMFDMDSDEFEVLMLIAEQWAAATEPDTPTNATTGEIVSRDFESYVRTKYPKLADAVRCDGTIYEAVMIEWSGN